MTLLVKSSKGGLRLYNDLKVLIFFLWEFYVLLLSEPFAIHETVILGKLFVIFSHF